MSKNSTSERCLKATKGLQRTVTKENNCKYKFMDIRKGCPRVDLTNKVLYVPVFGYVNDADDSLIRFFNVHELAHVKYTGGNASEKWTMLMKDICNSLEDCRIERAVSMDEPGLNTIVLEGHAELIRRYASEIDARKNSIRKVLDALYMEEIGYTHISMDKRGERLYNKIADLYKSWRSLPNSFSKQGYYEIINLAKKIEQMVRDEIEQMKKEAEEQQKKADEQKKEQEEKKQQEKKEKGESEEKEKDKGEKSEDGEESDSDNEEESEQDDSGKKSDKKSKKDKKEKSEEDSEEGSESDEEDKEEDSEEGSDEEDSKGGKSEKEDSEKTDEGKEDSESEDESEDNGFEDASKDDLEDFDNEDEKGESDDDEIKGETKEDGEKDSSEGKEENEGEESEQAGKAEGEQGKDDSQSGSEDNAADADGSGCASDNDEDSYVNDTIEELQNKADAMKKEVEAMIEDLAEILDGESKTFEEMINESMVEIAKESLAGCTYLPYTEGDRIQTVDQKDEEEFKDSYLAINTKMKRLQQVLEQVLQARRKIKKYRNLERGKFDVTKCHKLLKNMSNQVFYKKRFGEDLNTAVSLVIDLSGSMTSCGKDRNARAMTIALGETLSKLKIPFEVIGFNTLAWDGPDMPPFNRTIPLQLDIYKNFNDKYQVVKTRLGKMHGKMHNIDGESVKFAGERLKTRREQRKIMFVLSDGRPEGQLRSDTLNQNLKDELKRLRGEGVEIYSFGIMTEDPIRLYGREYSLYIPDVNTLGESFFKKLTEVMG